MTLYDINGAAIDFGGGTASNSELTNVLYNGLDFKLNTGTFSIGGLSSVDGSNFISGTRIRTDYISVLPSAKYRALISAGFKYNIFYYKSDRTYIKNDGFTTESGAFQTSADTAYIRFVVAYSDDSTATVSIASNLAFYAMKEGGNTEIPTVDTRGYTIRCAKERNYTDGTPTTVEWYLASDKNSNFYITKDFSDLRRVFRFSGTSFNYKFGVMPSGDILAVYRVENLGTSDGTDSVRQNPYVFLASEGWQTQHEIDFGDNLKPSGWLENCGFCSMPNGDVMFCEYTRPCVETANCWKVSGNPLDSSNWVVKKSFTLSGSNTQGFKHCHAVNYDFYNGVYYLCTGDDDTGAMVYYSKDDGETWTLAREASEKYCRILNMTFTKDYIYWASDSTVSHYLFRCERDANGVLDYSTITETKLQSGPASYGQVYIRELNILVMMDKYDDSNSMLTLQIYDLNDSTLKNIGTFESYNGNNVHLGFRTEYTEWYPIGSYILCGFGVESIGSATYQNLMKGLGNGAGTVNNLKIHVFKNEGGYSFYIETAFRKS